MDCSNIKTKKELAKALENEFNTPNVPTEMRGNVRMTPDGGLEVIPMRRKTFDTTEARLCYIKIDPGHTGTIPTDPVDLIALCLQKKTKAKPLSNTAKTEIKPNLCSTSAILKHFDIGRTTLYHKLDEGEFTKHPLGRKKGQPIKVDSHEVIRAGFLHRK